MPYGFESEGEGSSVNDEGNDEGRDNMKIRKYENINFVV